jgi:glycosyltransferase involved in cell wall biosynthesis
MTAAAPLVAVDLTPMRCGGEGGGNKVVAVSLLLGLRKREPGWRFLLLTSRENDQEAARLFGRGFERVCVAADLPAAEPGRASGDGFPDREAVDLLFCPFTPPIYADPWRRLVAIIHEVQCFEYPQFFDPLEVRDRQAHHQRLTWLADRIVCVSDDTRRGFLERHPAAADRVVVIGNAVHGRLPRPDAEEVAAFRRRLGIAGRPYLFYPANFWAHKNHRLLLMAWALFRRQHPEILIDLAFAGAMDRKGEEIRLAVRKMGLGGVHFLGFLDDRELAAAYAGCEALVFPSLHEGFGIPILEAMHLGRPVLCSNTTSLPMVAGGAALLFDPRRPSAIAEAMERVLTDAGLAADLAARGPARASRLSEPDMVSAYRDVLAAVLASPKRVPDAVAGLFTDGWVESQLTLTHGSGPEGRLWHLGLAAHSDIPVPFLEVALRDGASAPRWRIPRGTRAEIHVRLPVEEGRVVLDLQPALPLGAAGGDERRLSALCDTCRILRPDGTIETVRDGEGEEPPLPIHERGLGRRAGFRLLREDPSPKAAVDGIFGDGWTGEYVVVTHGPVEAGTRCEIQLSVPGEFDTPRTVAWWGAWSGSGQRQMAPGTSGALAIPLRNEGGHLTFRVSPILSPSRAGEHRALGVRCASCRIVRPHDSEGALEPGVEELLRRAYDVQGRRLRTERALFAAMIDQRDALLAERESVVERSEAEVVRLSRELEEHDRRIGELATSLAERQGALERSEAETARLRDAYQDQASVVEGLRRDLGTLLRSRSWRWTAPARRLRARLRGR